MITYCVLTSWIVGPINHADEEEDKKGYTDDDLGGVEEHKTIILHLLSQLKLGMDLTKVGISTWFFNLPLFVEALA